MAKKPYKKQSLAKTVSSIVEKKLKASVETKSHSSKTSSWTSVGWVNGSFIDLTPIAQGTGDGQRLGNSISVTKIHVQRALTLWDNNAGADSVRIIIGRARGRPLTSGDMPAYFDPCDLDLMYVYEDKFIPLSAAVYSGSSNQTLRGRAVRFDYSKKFKKPLNVHYDDANTTAVENQLFLYMLAGSLDSQQAGYASLYYKDA